MEHLVSEDDKRFLCELAQHHYVLLSEIVVIVY